MSGNSGKSVCRTLAFRAAVAFLPAATNGKIRRLALTKSGQPVADHYTRDARDSRRNQAETKSSNFSLNSRAQISDGSGRRFRTGAEIIQSVRSMHYDHIEQERWSVDAQNV